MGKNKSINDICSIIKIIGDDFMEKRKKELVKMLLNQNLEEKDEEEMIDLLINNPITIDVDKENDAKMSFGDKVADKLSEVAGSWTFIIIFCGFLLFWIVLNAYLLKNDAVDPYPFILLNLLLSCLAALQAPIIMMSQNRQAKKDTIRNKNDYRTDLKSELILEQICDRLEKVSKNQYKILNYLKKLDEEDKKQK